jgi:hypothetical protein
VTATGADTDLRGVSGPRLNHLLDLYLVVVGAST